MTRRTWKLVACAIVAAILAILWTSRDEAATSAPAAAPTATPTAATTVPRVRVDRADAVRRPPAQDGPPAQSPIIDAIEIEKQSVCEGDENLVTVRAHTPDHTDDAYLHVLVGNESGDRVPLRAHRLPGDIKRRVVVTGRNGTYALGEVPPFEVVDCRPSHRLLVTHRKLPNSETTLELDARVQDFASTTKLTPVRWQWDFGDGARAVTDVPFVEHEFANDERTQFSTHLVTCEATSADGEAVVGRHAVSLVSSSFENFAYKGVVVLRVALDPRFPELGADGVVREHVRLWHHHDAPVVVERVVVTKHFVDRDDDESTEVPAESLFGPGATIGEHGFVVAASLDTVAEPQVFSVTWMIDGITADGWPVRGSFSVMRPPPEPNARNARPVDDPVLVAKIKRAREILGTKTVTSDDLSHLEREGKLDGLDVGPAAPAHQPADPPPPIKPRR